MPGTVGLPSVGSSAGMATSAADTPRAWTVESSPPLRGTPEHKDEILFHTSQIQKYQINFQSQIYSFYLYFIKNYLLTKEYL